MRLILLCTTLGAVCHVLVLRRWSWLLGPISMLSGRVLYAGGCVMLARMDGSTG